MKITLEPTGSDKIHPTVSISVESDHLAIEHVIEKIIVPALMGWGFDITNIREQLR